MSHRRKDPDRAPKWCPNPACNQRNGHEGDHRRDVGSVTRLNVPRRHRYVQRTSRR